MFEVDCDRTDLKMCKTAFLAGKRNYDVRYAKVLYEDYGLDQDEIAFVMDKPTDWVLDVLVPDPEEY